VPKTGRTWPLITALIIGGCAGPEPPLTKFDQLSENEFLFGARTNLEYPENHSKAEATRMAWLEKALSVRKRTSLLVAGHKFLFRHAEFYALFTKDPKVLARKL
jgi:hypothetical protein